MISNLATIPFTLGQICGIIHTTLDIDNINTPINPQLELYIEKPQRLAMDILAGAKVVDGTVDELLDADDLLNMIGLYKALIARIDSGECGNGAPEYSRLDHVISKVDHMTDRLIDEINDLQKLLPEDVVIVNTANVLTPLRSESKIDNILLTILLGALLDIFKYNLHRNKILSYVYRDGVHEFIKYDESETPKLLFQVPKQSNKDK